MVATDRLRSLNERLPSAEVLKFVESEVERGRRYLRMANPSFGDSDITAHDHEFDELQSQLDALKLDRAAKGDPNSAAPTPQAS